MLDLVEQIASLAVVEVYIKHDRPLLYSSKDAINQLYLSILINEDVDEEIEEWMHLPVSYSRLQEIRAGGIDLYSAFKGSESGDVLIESLSFSENGVQKRAIERRPVIDLNERLLPKPGRRLNLSSRTLPSFIDESQMAISKLREIISIRLSFADEKRSEAPSHILGNVLLSLQEVLNSFVPDSWANVVAFEGGSFKVFLASRFQSNLFDESNVADAVIELEKVVKDFTSTSNKKEFLAQLEAKTKRPLAKLFKNLSSSVESADIRWASPRGQHNGQLEISAYSALSIWEAIREEAEPQIRLIAVKGELRGLDLKTGHFRIEDREREKSYSGYMVEEAKEDLVIQNAQMSHLYEAIIEESSIEFEQTRKYRLLKLEEA